MKKIDEGEFEISPGETVTITVTPIGVGAFVSASRAGRTLTPEPGTENTTPTYVFTPIKSSAVMMEFSFPGAPSTSRYRVVTTGSGGGDTGDFTIKQTASIKDPAIVFRVVGNN
jgi:hypothetical protein